MENQVEAFKGKQGKSQPVKSKFNRRIEQATKSVTNEQQLVQRRVFGTIRSTNVAEKTIPKKPEWKKPSLKPALITPPLKEPVDKTTRKQKQLPTKPSPKPVQPAQTTPPVPEEPSKTKQPKKKKSVSFLERGEGSRTPGPMKENGRVSGTPYHTAERCSKCRFDKMETASYWLAQVRLAESVGKHFVSAGLFKLAIESKAEPIRSIRAELNRYVVRHSYLSVEPEWRDLTTSHGLKIIQNNQVEDKFHDENDGDLDEAHKESIKQFSEQLEIIRKD